MLLSRKYIRKVFSELSIQLSEDALEFICEKLKIDVGKYALNAKDLDIKRVTKEKVSIIIGDFDA
jgi:DNA polymerase III delta subunit